MKPLIQPISVFALFYFFVSALAAQNPTVRESGRREPIELLSPRGTSVGQPGQIIYKHTGNVKLRHKGTLLFCDQTIQYVTDNRIESVGHVLLVQGDTIIVKADSLIYSGNDRQAILSGRVTFQDRRIVLNTARLEYDLTTGIAHYANRGRLVDSRNVMTSREGYYDTRSRQIEMKQGVRLVSPDNTLTADLLIYNTVSRMAVIVSPTRITGKDGVTVAQQGQYDTQNSAMQAGDATETLKHVGLNQTPQPAAAPASTVSKRSDPVPVKADATMAASQTSRPTLASDLAAGNPEVDKPVANPIANLTAAELMMRLTKTQNVASTTKNVTNPTTTVAKPIDTKLLPTPAAPVKPSESIAVVTKAASEPLKNTVSAPVLVASQTPTPAPPSVKQDVVDQTASKPATLNQSVTIAQVVDKPVDKAVAPPVLAVATSPNPQLPSATPVSDVETSVATVSTRPEKASDAGAVNVVPNAPKPTTPVLMPPVPKTSVADNQPVNASVVAASVATNKPVATPVTLPDAAVTIVQPNALKPAPERVTKPADRSLATVSPSSPKAKAPPEASGQPAVKKPVSPVHQPVTPEVPVNVAAVMVPPSKLDEQVLLATADAKKADLTKVAPTAADVRKNVPSATPAQPSTAAVQPSSIRTAALRVSVLPAAKRLAKPDALIVPDATMSDLERELNHKKRIH